MSSSDLSPHEMAEAVLAEAMKERGGTQLRTSSETAAPPTSNKDETNDKEITMDENGDDSYGSILQITDRLEDGRTTTDSPLDSMWNQGGSNDDSALFDKAYSQTMAMLKREIDALLQSGEDAFQKSESYARELGILKEEMTGMETEMKRLQESDEKSRTTIANLLRSADATKTKSRDASCAAATEASLRAQLSEMSRKHDEALAQAEESKRKATLASQEVSELRSKLNRITQEKFKMERDQRATMSLAKSLESSNNIDSSSAGDTDYYKRKVQELSSYIQGMNAVQAEKDRQIGELRRQLDRSMSQNRLASVRSGTDLNNSGIRKRPRK